MSSTASWRLFTVFLSCEAVPEGQVPGALPARSAVCSQLRAAGSTVLGWEEAGGSVVGNCPQHASVDQCAAHSLCPGPAPGNTAFPWALKSSCPQLRAPLQPSILLSSTLPSPCHQSAQERRLNSLCPQLPLHPPAGPPLLFTML